MAHRPGFGVERDLPRIGVVETGFVPGQHEDAVALAFLARVFQADAVEAGLHSVLLAWPAGLRRSHGGVAGDLPIHRAARFTVVQVDAAVQFGAAVQAGQATDLDAHLGLEPLQSPHVVEVSLDEVFRVYHVGDGLLVGVEPFLEPRVHAGADERQP